LKVLRSCRRRDVASYVSTGIREKVEAR